MNKITRPALYSVSSHQGFADTVAAYFLSKYGRNPLSLADGLILLPNNRAVSAIEEAFVRQTGKGLLLPRMVTIGDLDLNEKSGIFIDQFADQASDIMPAINPMQRVMMLAKMIERRHPIIMEREIDGAQAIKLAMDLAHAIDQLDVEEIAFDRFEELPAKEDMAEHWQKSYALFEDIYKEYRKEMQAKNLSTTVIRRNILIRSMAHNLGQLSEHPFVAAIGITTAAPAIAHLMRGIARMKNGMVILPHIDHMMSDEIWQSLGPHEKGDDDVRAKPSLESHPQFHLKLLLDKMGFDRSEVTPLGDAKRTKISDRKDQLVSHIFAPAKQTANWQSIDVEAVDFKHLKIMTNADSAAEAQAVAILVRRNLEISNKRIAIITPDRELARRISAHLMRWNIKADDSAGLALADTPSGSLFMAIAQTCANDFAPVDLLSLLKHPLVRKGDNRIAWLEKVRLLDLILRGPRAGNGLDIVAKSVHQIIERMKYRSQATDISLQKYDDLLAWWQNIQTQFANVSHCKTAYDLMQAIRNIADFLSGDEIWKGEAGREMSHFYTETISYISDGPARINIDLLPQFISHLMTDYTVRSAYGNHPRVAIYGLLEARLQRSDLIICAGLNEGSWPQSPSSDPWLAPGIRRDLGLPSLERNIGLSAHDLSEAIGAKELILSRSERDSGGPAVTSRFLLRLLAFAGDKLKYESNTPSLVALIDKPEKINPAQPPEPRPDKSQRLIRLSVTDMDKIKADPFAFYASKIMGLTKIEDIDADASAAWRGTMIHKILEQWASKDALEPDKLIARAHDLLANDALHVTARILWQPRLMKQIEWINEQTRTLVEEGRAIIAVESSGTTEIDGVPIKGVADRIDRLHDGTLAIIDYKSGAVPSNKQINAGFAMQLGLLGIIAERGQFSDLWGEAINGYGGSFEYWSLAKKDKNFGYIQYATKDVVNEKNAKTWVLTDEFTERTEGHARELIHSYILGDAPFKAQLHPEYAPYNEYGHLSRLMEWYGRKL